MGITGASLYNAFGGKRALYRRSLDHYLSQTFRERINRFEATLAPREALSAFFEEIVEKSLSDKQRRGCMLVNSALEITPHDPEFLRVVAKVLVQVEAFFCRCVLAGQRDGTIAKSQPAARHSCSRAYSTEPVSAARSREAGVCFVGRYQAVETASACVSKAATLLLAPIRKASIYNT